MPKRNPDYDKYYYGGFYSGEKGSRPKGSNPYSMGTVAAMAWANGWDAGNRKRQAKRLERLEALADRVARLKTDPERIDYQRLRAVVEMANNLR